MSYASAFLLTVAFATALPAVVHALLQAGSVRRPLRHWLSM